MNALIDAFLRIRSLWIKELLVILKDKSSRILLVMPILLQSIVFGYAVTYDLNDVPYAVYDGCRSAESRDILARLDGSGKFTRVATLGSSAQMKDVITKGDAILAIGIGSDLSDRLLSGRPADIQVIFDGRNSTTASIAAGYLSQIITGWNASRGLSPAISVQMRSWFNPQLETRWNMMPGMIATLSILQVLLLSSLSVAREREQGTFDQMLVTPLSPWEILIGKAVPPMLVGIVQSSLVLLISIFWFDIPFMGSLADLYISLILFTVSTVGIGLCVSALALNMQQAIVYCFMLIMPMMLLSGFVTPVSSMPHAMQMLTYANPVRFALVCIRSIYLEGASVADIADNFVPMLAVAAVTMPAAAWLFRNRLN